jgi:hypothetical protein
MPTVGEALQKVSELKSRWAILHELVVYLETHFKSSDAGEPELRITREDFATVPEDHIEAQIAHLANEMDQIQQELDEWGNLKITTPGDEDTSAKRNGDSRKTRKRGTARQRDDQTPAEDSGPEGSGQAA